MNRTYLRYEVLRTLRNRRFFFLSLGFPLVLYFLIATPNRDEIRSRPHRAVGPALLHGRPRRIRRDERDAVVRRAHLRRARGGLEPPAPDHAALRTGVLPRQGRDRLHDGRPHARSASYLAGATLGVSLTGSEWVRMTALILVGLLPFAALGIVLGHLLTPDSIGPAIGGLDGALRDPRRDVVPDHERRDEDGRRGATVVLARPGVPRRYRGPRAGRRPGGRSWRSGRSAVRCLQGGRSRDTQRV